MSASENDQVDLTRLAEEAEREADESEAQAEALRKRAEAPDNADELIGEVSKQLATIRRASELPDKDASDFARAIKDRQHAMVSSDPP